VSAYLVVSQADLKNWKKTIEESTNENHWFYLYNYFLCFCFFYVGGVKKCFFVQCCETIRRYVMLYIVKVRNTPLLMLSEEVSF